MAHDVALLLRMAHRRAAAAFTAALRPLGVEDRHFAVLLTLRRLGPLSQRQLIEAVGSDKSTMVRTIDELEHRGLAWRAPATSDRRAYAVELTPAGHALLTDAQAAADRAGTDLLAALDPREQDLLRTLLRRFIEAGPPAPPPPPDEEDPPGPAGPPPPEPAYAPPHKTRRARAVERARPGPFKSSDDEDPDAGAAPHRLTH
jgi:MarR family transcriptional regulator, lower aerobic nicotinate degradation pathway regulator